MRPLPIGIEEDLQIVDRDSRELMEFATPVPDQGCLLLLNPVDSHVLLPRVPVGDRVFGDLAAVRLAAKRSRTKAIEWAEERNRRVLVAGTHPFSRWQGWSVPVAEPSRAGATGMALHQLTFGLRIHVVVEEPDLRVGLMNQLRAYVPHLLCLSASSPYWKGRDTGVQSWRALVEAREPRTGLPEAFASAREYEDLARDFERMDCIADSTGFRWDIRPRPELSTLELRCCDGQGRLEDAIGLAALVQSLCATLIDRWRGGWIPGDQRRELLEENRWLAIHGGLGGSLLDPQRGRRATGRLLVEELLEFVEDAATSLGTRRELDAIRRMLDSGVSADRQRQVQRESGSLEAVVDALVEETRAGCEPARDESRKQGRLEPPPARSIGMEGVIEW